MIISLINRTFRAYSQMAVFFYQNIHHVFTDNAGRSRFITEIHRQVFDEKHFKNLETYIDEFKKLQFKLEEITEKDRTVHSMFPDLINVCKKISAFLSYHSEIFKYRKDNFTPRDTVNFFIEIDRIGIEWDACLNNYVSGCRYVDNNPADGEDGDSLSLLCIMPADCKLDAIAIQAVLDIIGFVFDIAGDFLALKNKSAVVPVINKMESDTNIYLGLTTATPNVMPIAGKIFQYLTAETIHNPKLIAHAMETVRLNFPASITAAALKKKAAKFTGILRKLPDGARFQIEEQHIGDNVAVISDLYHSIESYRRDKNSEKLRYAKQNHNHSSTPDAANKINRPDSNPTQKNNPDNTQKPTDRDSAVQQPPNSATNKSASKGETEFELKKKLTFFTS